MTQHNQAGHRQRVRERFLQEDQSSRSEVALIELLLTYAIPQKDVRPLADRLLTQFGSLSGVLAAPIESLCDTDGIKESGAILLKLVDWIRQHHGAKPSRKEVVIPVTQTKLFKVPPPDKDQQTVPIRKEARREKAIRRRGTEMFGKAVLKEAIQLLPSLPDTEFLDEIRSFLRSNLHFSAELTRQRYANYITRRMFPEGYADKPLRLFAKALPETQDLREVCFYRFLKAEPFEIEVIENLILPNLGNGHLSRQRIRSYLSERFPEAKSIIDSGKAIVDALTAAAIVKAERIRITFAYRDIPVPAFAFILHSEFPAPGMFDILKLEQNRVIRAMLWKPDRLLPSLYELRNQGLISKVSEIDNVRQFTTKFRLAEAVDHLIAKRANS